MSKVIKPMLAHFYKPEKFTPFCWVQPKLDGIRALYQNGKFVSRTGKVWGGEILKHISDELKQCIPKGMVLDGELYCHGMQLQDINKRVAVKRGKPHPDILSIKYHVFDVVDSKPWIERAGLFKFQYPAMLNTVLVPTNIAPTIKDGDVLYNYYRQLGYEGIMYRHHNDGYSMPWECSRKDNRSWSLMKRKGGFDLSNCEIHEVIQGEGKYSNSAGYLIISHPDVPSRFRVGSGLSDMERDLLYQNRDKIQGCTVDIRFDEYSKDHIPLRLRVSLLHLNAELYSDEV